MDRANWKTISVWEYGWLLCFRLIAEETKLAFIYIKCLLAYFDCHLIISFRFYNSEIWITVYQMTFILLPLLFGKNNLIPKIFLMFLRENYTCSEIVFLHQILLDCSDSNSIRWDKIVDIKVGMLVECSCQLIFPCSCCIYNTCIMKSYLHSLFIKLPM